jgi:hypothetical protein
MAMNLVELVAKGKQRPTGDRGRAGWNLYSFRSPNLLCLTLVDLTATPAEWTHGGGQDDGRIGDFEIASGIGRRPRTPHLDT